MKDFNEVKREVFKRSNQKIIRRNNAIMVLASSACALILTIGIASRVLPPLLENGSGISEPHTNHSLEVVEKTYCSTTFFECQAAAVLKETVGISVKGNGFDKTGFSDTQEEAILAKLKALVSTARENGVEAGSQFDNSKTSLYVSMRGTNGAERTVILSGNLLRDELGVWYNVADALKGEERGTLQEGFESVVKAF